MVDAVLFVRKLPAALGAHEGVVLATLVLEVPVEVVIPVVRSLKEKKLIFVCSNISRGGCLHKYRLSRILQTVVNLISFALFYENNPHPTSW